MHALREDGGVLHPGRAHHALLPALSTEGPKPLSRPGAAPPRR
ncbi:hypothetical protein P2318_27510 [Myxococcaceae bacterium GXIMD 01537]